MGYINHQAIIAVGPDLIKARDEHLRRDLEQLVDAPFDQTAAQLLVGPVRALANGYVSYALLPDGSKEGWATSDLGDRARDVFVKHFQAFGSYAQIVTVSFDEDLTTSAVDVSVTED